MTAPPPAAPDAAPASVLPLTADEVRELTRTTATGGVALFPAEGVYGLAADPDRPEAVLRVARLKGRDPQKPSSVLFWTVDDALAAIDGAGPLVLEALGRLVPGPVGLLVPNPAARFGVATGPDPSTLGVRVPLLPEPVAAPPVVQTSANRAGGPDPATVAAVPRPIRRACELVLDRGARPGTPSTIVDLRGLATGADATWRIVREGAVPVARVAELLADVGSRAG